MMRYEILHRAMLISIYNFYVYMLLQRAVVNAIMIV